MNRFFEPVRCPISFVGQPNDNPPPSSPLTFSLQSVCLWPGWVWSAHQRDAAKVRRLQEAGAAPSLRMADATFGSYPLHAAANAQAPAAIAVLMEWHMPRALPVTGRKAEVH